jgi:hypothetical protein
MRRDEKDKGKELNEEKRKKIKEMEMEKNKIR